MLPAEPQAVPSQVEYGRFATTHWSVILAAQDLSSPQAGEAMEKLCLTYWLPLYAFVRQRGYGPEDAQDLTQEFFTRFLKKNSLGQAEQARGKFRNFLLVSLKNFLADEWDHHQAEKRGGGARLISLEDWNPEREYLLEPAGAQTPDQAYDRRWAYTVLDQAALRLRQEYAAAGKAVLYEQLMNFLSAEAETYAAAAARLGVPENSLKSLVHRLRQRKQELIREVIADTVAGPAEVDEELRELIAVLKE